MLDQLIRIVRRVINKRNKELEHVLKEFSISENVFAKQLSTTDFFLLKKPITLQSKKLLQQSLCIH